MSDISKEELKKEIEEILKDADLDNTSAKKVRLQLQEKLECDLTERKKEVDALVMEVIDEQTQDEAEDEEEDEDEEELEEEEKPRKKSVAKKRAGDSDSDSDYEEHSDGGGSDYEPDEPVKIQKRSAPKKKKKFGSDNESSGEEWGSKSKSKKVSKKKKKNSSDSEEEKPKKKRKSGGYTAPVKLSADLADIVGGDVMPRHEVVKKMWQYIKDNQLQDPKNKQMIKCDDKLSKIVPTKKFRGFGMAKFLKDHMSKEI